MVMTDSDRYCKCTHGERLLIQMGELSSYMAVDKGIALVLVESMFYRKRKVFLLTSMFDEAAE